MAKDKLKKLEQAIVDSWELSRKIQVIACNLASVNYFLNVFHKGLSKAYKNQDLENISKYYAELMHPALFTIIEVNDEFRSAFNLSVDAFHSLELHKTKEFKNLIIHKL